MIVMKFGGTSTQDAAAMTNVARIVKERASQRPVVVISAIARATNALEKIGALAAQRKEDEARQVAAELIGRHVAIVETLVKDQRRSKELRDHLSGATRELEELARGVAILRELTPRTLDTFYSYGELLSSRLVAAVLQENGVDAMWLDTAEFMVTDENHAKAVPMMDIVEERLRSKASPAIARGTVVVTQGYLGVTQGGRRTTMGRESSDYSAAVIGAALGAEDIQIWTDVDGILTADPRIVKSPYKVIELSFDEAFELSFFGAKVLHPNTMLPAIEKNIPIHIYNSKNPASSGTRVVAGRPSHAPAVKSIAYKHNAVLITAKPIKRHNQFIFWEHLFNILTKYDAPPGMAVTSEFSIGVVLDGRKDIPAITHELAELGTIEMSQGKGILCIVGSQLKRSRLVVARLMKAVGDVPIHAITFGASETNISMLLEDEDVDDAVRRVHDEFFGEISDNTIFEAPGERVGALAR